jgi:cytochrome b involved in lipid metabolism
MMKKQELQGVIIILFIFVIALGMGVLMEKDVGKKESLEHPASDVKTQDLPEYTLEEVARHNVLEDCWMVFNGEVFDFTGEFGGHPGGADTLLSGCGKEATDLFESVHLQRTIEAGHDDYLVGILK